MRQKINILFQEFPTRSESEKERERESGQQQSMKLMPLTMCRASLKCPDGDDNAIK